MMSHEYFIKRCFDLARQGAATVAPNPMVGAVIVHNNRIIGEGFHKQYGKAHAEVNAIANVAAADKHLLPKSTIYVSLEPCCIYGKTPPCTKLILKNKIPNVVISYIDKYLGDNGKSVQILQKAGVKVTTKVLERQGINLCKVRDTYTQNCRPYVILKYAISQNNYMGKAKEQIWLSNSYTKRLVHKWRSEVGAILIGTNTARIDNPRLTNRLYFGGSPLRVVLDKNLNLPKGLHISKDVERIVFVTEKLMQNKGNKTYLQLKFDKNLLPRILNYLYEQKISSLLVEGGARTLQHFIDQNLWDEARILQTSKQIKEYGIAAPQIAGKLERSITLATDKLLIYSNPS